MTYANGDYVSYTYDLFDRPVKTVYTDVGGAQRSDEYVYNANGALAMQRSSTGEVYRFEYDSLGRLIRSAELDGNDAVVQCTEHLYDTANRLTSQSWTVGSDTYTESYTYRSYS